MSKENKITAYKGFNKDLTCNGFQYEIGKEYEMPEDEVQICRAGFHACESPLEVLGYYFMDDNCDMARFAEVEQSGKISMEKDGSTKMASSKIRIKAELKFSDLVKIGIDWLIEKTKPVIGKKGRNNDGGEDSAQIGSSGYSAKIGSSGDSAQIGSSGYSAKIGSSGYSAQIGSSGYSAKIGSSGDYAQIGSSGDYAKIGSSGYSAKIGSSGYSAQIGSSGDYAKIGSSGYSAKIGSSGYSAKIGSSGDSAQIGSSGDYAKIGSSGDYAKIGSSGDYAKLNSTGEDSVICCAGHGSRVKAKLGSWITLAEWEWDDAKRRNVPKMVKTVQIDGENYKPDTWYCMKDGAIVEVK